MNITLQQFAKKHNKPTTTMQANIHIQQIKPTGFSEEKSHKKAYLYDEATLLKIAATIRSRPRREKGA